MEKSQEAPLSSKNRLNIGISMWKSASAFNRLETNPETNKIAQAIKLSESLHGDQKERPDGPYPNHVHRVAYRILKEFGIQDQDILIAAMFHDSVEDQAEKLAKLAKIGEDEVGLTDREKAFLYLEQTFGSRVKELVEGVTNPEVLSELQGDEKNSAYEEHVSKAITDPGVFIIKLSDFMDNGLDVLSIEDPARRLKLCKKYLPLFAVFVERLGKDDLEHYLKPDKKAQLITALESAESSIRSLINANNPASNQTSPLL